MFSADEINPNTGESKIPTIIKPSRSGSFNAENMRIDTVEATTIIAKSFSKNADEWVSIWGMQSVAEVIPADKKTGNIKSGNYQQIFTEKMRPKPLPAAVHRPKKRNPNFVAQNGGTRL